MGESERAYALLSQKFNKKFQDYMFLVLVHKYQYFQLGRPTITDSEYDFLKAGWYSIAKDLGIDMEIYPYKFQFPFSHPRAREAAAAAKKALGIDLWHGCCQFSSLWW